MEINYKNFIILILWNRDPKNECFLTKSDVEVLKMHVFGEVEEEMAKIEKICIFWWKTDIDRIYKMRI